MVGASNDLGRIGGQPIRFLTEFGFRGGVYPVNPKYKTIAGLPCAADVREIGQPCDVALIAVQTALVPGVVRACGDARIPFAVILSAGFAEVGEAGRTSQHELRSAIDESGVRVIGPNCVGILNLPDRVFCGFGGLFRNPDRPIGNAAIVTQSGGFGTAIVGLAEFSGLAFRYVASTGNEVDISTIDVLEWYIEQSDVDVAITYMEGIRDGTRLRALGRRALELGKPILVWKVGNTEVGRRTAASHTAALTGRYELYQQAFREGGFVEVDDVQGLVDIAQVFAAKRFPKSRGVAVVSASGGAGVLLADRCTLRGLELSALAPQTGEKLRDILPEFGSLENPIDMTAQGFNSGGDPLEAVLPHVLQDTNVDQIIARGQTRQGADAEAFAHRLSGVVAETDKLLVLCGGIPPGRGGDAEKILAAGHIPYYHTPARAADATAALSDYAEKRRRLSERVRMQRELPAQPLTLPARSGALAEHEAKEALRAYGIPVVREVVVPLCELEDLKALDLRFPVVVKVASADIPHKTEAGAVRLHVRDLGEVREAAADVVSSARRFAPDATIEHVLVAEMTDGLEVIVGAVDDPTFGPTLLFGLGGVTAELLKDVAFRFAPLDAVEARKMIESIKAAPLFNGYRGRPPLDVAALAETIARLSWLMSDHCERIAEIDVNPIFVREAGAGCVAADALVVLK